MFRKNILADNEYRINISHLEPPRWAARPPLPMTISAIQRSFSVRFEWQFGNFGPALRAGPVTLDHRSAAGVIAVFH